MSTVARLQDRQIRGKWLRMKAWMLLRLFRQLALLTCVLTLTGFLGKYSWLLDLTSHFRVQYLLVQVLALVVLLCVRARFFWLLPIAFSAGVNFAQILPYFSPPRQGAPRVEAIGAKPPAPARLRILHMNVLKFAGDAGAVERAIEQAQPDVLSLQELNVRWRGMLARSKTLERFPYRHVDERAEIAFYSRLPVERSEIINSTHAAQSAAIVADLRLWGQPVQLVFLHPPAPVNVAYANEQRQLFEDLVARRRAGEFQRERVFIGDLNASPWGWPFKRLTRGMAVRDFRLGRGLLLTWPHLPFTPLMLPIDHVLVSEGWQVMGARIGAPVGSDHLPVLVDLRLQPRDAGGFRELPRS